jgi:hypothetical protein
LQDIFSKYLQSVIFLKKFPESPLTNNPNSKILIPTFSHKQLQTNILKQKHKNTPPHALSTANIQPN